MHAFGALAFPCQADRATCSLALVAEVAHG
jgi:hypothetical protein